MPLNLPAEIPYLAPTQEWRIVWDSALDRKRAGRGHRVALPRRGDLLRPAQDANEKGKRAGTQFRSTAVLDWATLHPVERLELLTTHDLARQEKQKLELLRNLLTYYHYATSESREEVLRTEINRMRAAADELRERYRAQYNAPADDYDGPAAEQRRLRRGPHDGDQRQAPPPRRASASLPDRADAALPEAELRHAALLRLLATLRGAALGFDDDRLSASALIACLFPLFGADDSVPPTCYHAMDCLRGGHAYPTTRIQVVGFRNVVT